MVTPAYKMTECETIRRHLLSPNVRRSAISMEEFFNKQLSLSWGINFI